MTKKDLQTHPFAAQFDRCDSPAAVLDVFRKQAQAFDEFRKGDDSLMTWLDPTVNILFTCSATLGEGLALVVRLEGFIFFVSWVSDTCSLAFLSCKNDLCRDQFPPHRRSLPKFLGIRMSNVQHFQAAKNVVASHNTLVNLFERIQFFLQRLKIYTGIQLTTEMKELLGKTMSQILSILAISTKEMSESWISELIHSIYDW